MPAVTDGGTDGDVVAEVIAGAPGGAVPGMADGPGGEESDGDGTQAPGPCRAGPSVACSADGADRRPGGPALILTLRRHFSKSKHFY